jgi:phospholipase/lecithinase/hemolysin
VWGGGNDTRDLVGNASPQAGVQTALSSLNGVLTGLLDAGARTLLVPSLPDLGRIPENRNTVNAASASFVSGLWNDGLFSVLSGLAGQYASASIYYLDVFGIFNSVLDNPSSFGFTNTTGQCRSVTNFGFTETSCANPDTWVFWDAIHPTRAAHAVVGARPSICCPQARPCRCPRRRRFCRWRWVWRCWPRSLHDEPVGPKLLSLDRHPAGISSRFAANMNSGSTP